MTYQEINIAIAQCCGWKDISFNGWNDPVGHDPDDDRLRALPNFCLDLNAIHKATMNLTLGEKDDIITQLGKICSLADRLTFASAIQRAEAFLRTKGLWKE